MKAKIIGPAGCITLRPIISAFAATGGEMNRRNPAGAKNGAAALYAAGMCFHGKDAAGKENGVASDAFVDLKVAKIGSPGFSRR